MKYLSKFGVATLLMATATAANATNNNQQPISVGGPEIETTQNANLTANPTINTGVKVGTHVVVPVTNNIGGPEIETTVNAPTTNNIYTNVGGPEIETNNRNNNANSNSNNNNANANANQQQGQGQHQGQTANGGSSEVEVGGQTSTQDTNVAIGDNTNTANGGSSEVEVGDQTTTVGGNNSSYTNNSTYKAAAAGSAVSAGPVYVPSKCMDGWSISLAGAQLSGSAGIGFSKVNPAGVYLKNNISLDDYAKSQDIDYRASATDGFTKSDHVKLSCLEKAIDEREDNQDHQLKVIHATAAANTAGQLALQGQEHFCKRDAKLTVATEALDDEHQSGCRDYSNTGMGYLFGEAAPYVPAKTYERPVVVAPAAPAQK